MSEIKLTDDQRKAVFTRGHSILVSAAAGSGKTKVLVERLFSYISQEHCNVDDFLIITYTNAAAAELRSKIAQDLGKRVAQEPENKHLRSQLYKVYQADIKTIDAFCVSVLRDNTHLLQQAGEYALTPDFHVLDEQDAKLLKVKVLDRCLDSFYESMQNGNESNLLLAETLGFGRNDDKLVETVLELHSKIQSQPYPILWLSQYREFWANLPEKIEQTPYPDVLMDDAVLRASFWQQQIRDVVKFIEQSPVVTKAYASVMMDYCFQLQRFCSLKDQGWDAMKHAIPVADKLGRASGDGIEIYKEKAALVWKNCKEDMKKVATLFEATSQQHMEDLRRMAPAMVSLMDLTALFTQRYQEEKIHRNVIDFSDQEHLAISLLIDDHGQPTELAQHISGRYREIMVDEYQDTNQVQNCIFDAISKQSRNLFMVGDVKQSIYRFRLADPTIFLKKYNEYPSVKKDILDDAGKILMKMNFRSRNSVLDATNFIFRNIMSEQMGEMVYGEDEKLNCGADYYKPSLNCDTEFHMIALRNTEEETYNREETEAMFIAQRIRSMLDEGYLVQGDDGELRPVRAEDFVILMRSPKNRIPAFTRALSIYNIPSETQENENVFISQEIHYIYSLLTIIDNPHQDIPLIAVLRSPVFGFSPDRLAQIHQEKSESDFYGMLTKNDGQDCLSFLDTLNGYRKMSRELPVDQLIWQIYCDQNLLGVFGAMQQGEKRIEHLLAFYNYAMELSQSGKSSLFSFLVYLRSLEENEALPDLHGASDASGVRIMTIHKSKGLEFPVVFLCDLHKKFNEKDSLPNVLVHSKIGLGTECIDLQRRIHYPTISKSSIARLALRENRSEEMRILYVAMTRAKEKLIMVDCMSKAEKHVSTLLAETSTPVHPESVGKCNCFGDWILLSILNTENAACLHHWLEMDPTNPTMEDCGITVRLWQNPSFALHSEDGNVLNIEDKKHTIQILDAPYAHVKAQTIPTKVTATQLKGREADNEISEGSGGKAQVHMSFDQPKFMQETRKLTSAEIGTATHLLMQYLDYSLRSEEEVQKQLQDLVDQRLMTQLQAESIDLSKINAFLNSDLCRDICQSKNVLREYQFSILVDASMVEPTVSDEQIMLQGVVDCAYETEDGLVVVDFKTDRITLEEAPERAKKYEGQLNAYAHALSRVRNKPVILKKLYFFTINQVFNL